MIANTDGALWNFRGPIIKSLLKFRVELDTISSQTMPEYFSYLKKAGVTPHELDFHRHSTSVIQSLRQIYYLTKKINTLRPDIVHNYTHKPAIFGTIAAKFARVPKIFVTVTGLGQLFIKTDLKSIFFRNLLLVQYKFAMLFVDKIFFQNPDDMNLFVSKNIIRKDKAILTNGSGVDLEEYSMPNETDRDKARAALFADLGIEIDNRLIVVFPARCIPEKGFFEFYNAARILSEKFPNEFLFIHIGATDNDLKDYVSAEDVKKFAENNDVKFLGYQNDVKPYFLASDIVALPSYREGVPRSLLEALSLGCTLVTTDVPGCRETVVDGWNGFLCPPKDITGLVEAIEKAASANRRQIACRSRSLCEDKFDVDILISKTFQVYGIQGN